MYFSYFSPIFRLLQNKSYESKAGCNRTPATVLLCPLFWWGKQWIHTGDPVEIVGLPQTEGVFRYQKSANSAYPASAPPPPPPKKNSPCTPLALPPPPSLLEDPPPLGFSVKPPPPPEEKGGGAGARGRGWAGGAEAPFTAKTSPFRRKPLHLLN